eukprot:gene8274-99_t
MENAVILENLIILGWCSMENFCTDKSSNCLNTTISYLGDEKTRGIYTKEDAKKILVRSTKYPENYLDSFKQWDFNNICEEFKIIKQPSKCPDFESSFSWTKPESVVNLIVPLANQPFIVLNDAVKNSNFLNQTWLNQLTIVPGVFFHGSDIEARSFSYTFHVIHSKRFIESPYYVDDDQKNIELSDLSFTGPTGFYQTGYVVVLQRGGKFQCSFTKEKHDIKIVGTYLSFFGGLIIGLGVVFFILYFTLICLVLGCNGNYEEEKLKDAIYLSNADLDTNSSRYYYTFKNTFLDAVITLIRGVDLSNLKQIGTQAYFFVKYFRILMVIVILFFVSSVPLMILDFIIRYDRRFSAFDLSTISMASVDYHDNWHSLYSIFHYLSSFFNMLLVISFIGAIFELSKRILPQESYIEKTVWISKIPKELLDENIIIEKLKLFFPEEILSFHFAYDFEQLHENIKEKTSLQDDLNFFENIKSNKSFKEKWYQLWKYKSENVDYEIEILNEKLKMIDEKIQIEKSKDLKGTGNAFVTFISKPFAKKCIELAMNDWNTNSDIKQDDNFLLEQFSFQPAPKPVTINWQNLGIGDETRRTRKLIAYFILVATFCIFLFLNFLFITLSTYRSIFTLPLSRFSQNSNRIVQTLLYIGSFIINISSLLNLMFIISTFAIVSFVVSFVKYPTTTYELKSNARGVLFFLFLNGLVIPRIFVVYMGLNTAFTAVSPFDTYDYFLLNLSPDVMNVMILVPFIFKSLSLIGWIKHFIQEYANKKKIKRLELSYHSPVATSMYNFIHVFYFGSVIPIISLVGLIYFIFDYILNLVTILYFFKKSHDGDSTYLRESVRNLLIFVFIYPMMFGILTLRFFGFFYLTNLLIHVAFALIFGITIFYFYNKQKFHKLMEKSSSVNLLDSNEELINKYKHPLLDFVQDELIKNLEK